MSSIEFGPNGAATPRGEAVETIKAELTHRQHAFENGRTRSVAGLARYARLSLAVAIVMMALGAVAIALYTFAPDVLPDIFYQWGEGDFNAGYLLDWGYTASVIVAFVCVGRFTYRAMKNLHTLGNEYAHMPPGWTVGWYFIPLASLWQPVMGMSQIWRGSHQAAGEPQPSMQLLTVWWAAWILQSVPDLLAGLWEGSDLLVVLLYAASSVLTAVAAGALYVIIGRIAALQDTFERGGVASVFE
ncbi:MAG: DUF4328 domain-containing protein [Hyphomonas sp.]